MPEKDPLKRLASKGDVYAMGFLIAACVFSIAGNPFVAIAWLVLSLYVGERA